MDGRKTIKQTYHMWLSIYINNEAHERNTREREGGREGERTEGKQLSKHIKCGCQYIPTMRHMRGTQEREREEGREKERKENN